MCAADAAGRAVDGVELAGLVAEVQRVADDGRLRAHVGHLGKGQAPGQLQSRHVVAVDARRARRHKAAVVRRPVPSWPRIRCGQPPRLSRSCAPLSSRPRARSRPGRWRSARAPACSGGRPSAASCRTPAPPSRSPWKSRTGLPGWARAWPGCRDSWRSACRTAFLPGRPAAACRRGGWRRTPGFSWGSRSASRRATGHHDGGEQQQGEQGREFFHGRVSLIQAGQRHTGSRPYRARTYGGRRR